MQDSAFFATVTATHELIASNEVIRTATGNVVVCEYDLPSFVFWYAEWGTNYFVEASASNEYSDLLFIKNDAWMPWLTPQWPTVSATNTNAAACAVTNVMTLTGITPTYEDPDYPSGNFNVPLGTEASGTYTATSTTSSGEVISTVTGTISVCDYVIETETIH